jgi:hypothetical protein
VKSSIVVRCAAFIGLALGVVLAGPLCVAEAPPAVDKDGLHLVKQTKQRLVYVKPGATLSPYKRVAILDCLVEFQKNWQRDYNANAVTLSQRVSDSDIKRMKDALAAEFKRVFADELQKGGYQVVNTAAPDVLVLRPALINVAVTSPDLMTANVTQVVVDSAGQMTLYLELLDSSTNTLLARAMDAQADDQAFGRVANRVTNSAAAEEILRRWAQDVRKHLDAARGKDTG